MRKILLLALLFFLAKINAQVFSGNLFLRDHSSLYLNQIYVTNINTQKTVLSDYDGSFKIYANSGDLIRFTSIVTERKDITLTADNLANQNNLIELLIAYHEISEVVINSFKPTGNLRKDVKALDSKKGTLAIAKLIGLPEPKGDGNPPMLPISSFSGGGLTFSIESIYDMLSGDRKRKERYYEYEKMNKNIIFLKNYFGEEYFNQLKIPKNLVENFLQFVYSSDNLYRYVENNNLEATKISMEKYLPIYQKRLRNSHLQEIIK